MELRRIGDSVLRLGQSPLLTVLTQSSAYRQSVTTQSPSIARTITTISRQSGCQRRAFSSSGNLHKDSASSSSDDPSTTTSEGAFKPFNADAPPPTPPPEQQPVVSYKPFASTRRSSSLTDMLASFRTSGPRYESRTPQSSRRVPTDQMLSPRGPANGPPSSYATSTAPDDSSNQPPVVLPPLRLNSSVGRSVFVDKRKGVDLMSALRILRSNISQNAVARDVRTQRFHERPGLKRKRLKSERWRKTFKKGFQKMVYRIKDMRKKGW